MTDEPVGNLETKSATSVIEAMIADWQMAPHPEGGWFREVYRSDLTVTRADGVPRNGLTTILFLLDAGSASRWHRVRQADEVWIHLQGAPLSLWSLPPSGGTPSRQVLSLQNPVHVIQADHWQAAQAEGPYSLVSCCVGPGFDFEDFDMLKDLPRDQWPTGVLEELV